MVLFNLWLRFKRTLQGRKWCRISVLLKNLFETGGQTNTLKYEVLRQLLAEAKGSSPLQGYVPPPPSCLEHPHF